MMAILSEDEATRRARENTRMAIAKALTEVDAAIAAANQCGNKLGKFSRHLARKRADLAKIQAELEKPINSQVIATQPS